MSSHSAPSHAAGHSTAAAHDAHDIKAHVKTYMMVFGALAVLTVVTVAVSYIHLPTLPAVTLGLLIATIKASLVAMFFMHLKGERRSVVWALLLTAIFFVVLMTIPYSWWLDGPKHHGSFFSPAKQSTPAGAGHAAPEEH